MVRIMGSSIAYAMRFGLNLEPSDDGVIIRKNSQTRPWRELVGRVSDEGGFGEHGLSRPPRESHWDTGIRA